VASDRRSLRDLSLKDQERLAEATPFGKHVRFPGFGENFDEGYIGAANFMVEQLGNFRRFKGRDLNGHFPNLAVHRRVLAVYEPLLKKASYRPFTVEELTEILNAQRDPDSSSSVMDAV